MASTIPGAPMLSAARARTAFLSSYSATASSQCRQFSLATQRNGAQRGVPQAASIRQPAQPSMKTRREGVSRAELPQDLGLLPGTFVRPLWRDLPSIFHHPRERMHLEWLWVKTAFQNFMGVVVYSKTEGRSLPLRLKERRQVARDLHKKMYTAFAEGNVSVLRKICCTGLANNLSNRIAARPRSQTITWNLDKYIRGPSTYFTGIRILADRATKLPEIRDSGVRQVVVRITTRQSTSKSQRHATKDQNPVETKQSGITEYIVLQKLRYLGEDEPWRIWGYAKATTMDDLSSPHFAMGLSPLDRMEAIKAEMGVKK
ncbi:hypothetical protein BDW69DRAFT_168455 [Aspergillus filifer]